MARSKYDIFQSVTWNDVLKAINFRARWHYVHFESFEEEIGNLLRLRKQTDREKEMIQFKAKLAIGELNHLFYWQRVHDEVRAFLRRPKRDLDGMDMAGCRRFYDMYRVD